MLGDTTVQKSVYISCIERGNNTCTYRYLHDILRRVNIRTINYIHPRKMKNVAYISRWLWW